MADVSALTNLAKAITPEATSEYLAKISKELAYLLNNLDSLNVTSLDTTLTTITGGEGTTVMNGSTITMKDAAGVTRLVLGLDTSDVFHFEMYDITGALSMALNSNGTIKILGGSGISNLTDAGSLAVKDAVNFLIPGDILNAGSLAVKNAVDFLIAGDILNAGGLAILDTINGTHIDNNSISTPKLQANSITSNEIYVDNLSVISANLGEVTAGTIIGNTISGGTISGTIITGTSITGGTINIGSGTFEVDSSGSVTIKSAAIDISESVSIGEKLYISKTNWGAGIRWVSTPPGGQTDPEIYIDPATGTMFIESPGGVHINGVPFGSSTMTAVWG